jgi:hypothetical protein
MKLVLGIKNGRSARTLAGLAAIGVGAMLVSSCGSSGGTNSGANSAGVTLSPASGSVYGTPSYTTQSACPSGFQGSGIFRAIRPDGSTFSISGGVANVTVPFHGSLLGSIAEIEMVSNINTKTATQKYVIVCFSGPSLTGKSRQEMSTVVTYSGTTYKSGTS